MVQLTSDHLIAFLKGKGYQPKLENEGGQVIFQEKIHGHDFPVFMRIYPEAKLLQVLIFLPIEVKESTIPDLARQLLMFNKELDIPGFGLDEQSRTTFFRVMIPAHNKEIEESILENFLNTMSTVVDSFTPAISTVASGQMTFTEMLQRIKENSKQQ